MSLTKQLKLLILLILTLEHIFLRFFISKQVYIILHLPQFKGVLGDKRLCSCLWAKLDAFAMKYYFYLTEQLIGKPWLFKLRVLADIS